MTGPLDRLAAALRSSYRLERELGQGGMATVYLAEDLRHHRHVAVKVLRPELAAVIGAERFLHEITTTANLQHPHILPLHDSGQVDGTVYYVMPFIEGETLRDRLAREHQLPVAEAVRLATEVAGALDYAHRKGVIHRDIKPENILLHEGQALVADFGIALAAATTGGSRITETGMSLGTPHYMSPEQAMGERTLDARADVYALGCVLYEMLVGEPPFTGPTAQAIVARVLTGVVEPPAIRRPTVPPNVDGAVLTALQKLPADRFESAKAFAEALHDRNFGPAAPHGATAAATRWNRISVAAVAVAALALVVAGWAIRTRSPTAAKSVLRVSIELPDSLDLAPNEGGGGRLALAPDGSRLVFAGGNPAASGPADAELWQRCRDQLQAVRIAGTEGGRGPFFAQDGHHLGYFTRSASLVVVDLDGGLPVALADTGVAASGGGAFGPDGAEDRHDQPDVLPNGRGVIFTVTHTPTSDVNRYDVAVLDLKTGKHRALGRGVLGRYTAGFLLFVRADGVLAAARFDQSTLSLTGPEVPIVNGIKVGQFGRVDLVIGRDGTLSYVAGQGVARPADIVWVARDGLVTLVDSAWRVDFDGVSLSPDGGRLAVGVADGLGEDIWVKHLPDGPKTKLTLDGGRNHRPTWLSDGRKIAYVTEENLPIALVAKRADGIGATEVLARDPRNLAAGLVSPDGHWVVYRTSATEAGAGDILAKRAGDSAGTPLVATSAEERHPALSPDGRWLAYRSDETGRNEVYVRPFPNVGDGKWAVSTAGGSDPVWAHSGRELFYLNEADEMVAAAVVTQPSFSTRAQRVLFALPAGIRPNNAMARYDVTRDDQRFVMIRDAEAESGKARRDRVILVTNFLEELKAKLAGPK